MAEQFGSENRFTEAFQRLIEQIEGYCAYRTERYMLALAELGGVPAAKRLLAGPLSDDSIQLWARGRRDLTVEALVLSDNWRIHFSEEECAIAQRRYADMSSSTESIPQEFADDLREVTRPRRSATLKISSKKEDSEVRERLLPEGFEPDDDIAWNEELMDNIAVCDKLGQVERALPHPEWGWGGWWLAHFRKHLESCVDCDTQRSLFKKALQQFDDGSMTTIAELLRRCVTCLDLSESGTRKLLEAEWTERDSAGDVTFRSRHWEAAQLDQWSRLLHLRAAQLNALTGVFIRDYEETHVPSFWNGIRWKEDTREFLGNPWRVWRFEAGQRWVRDFVRRFKDDEFAIMLAARTIARMGLVPPGFSGLSRNVPTLPSDGDLDGLEEVLSIRNSRSSDEWETILSENFGGTFKELDWEEILEETLKVAISDARREASATDSDDLASMRREVTNLKDSFRAFQIGVLERWGERMRDDPTSTAKESLQTALGSEVYAMLTPEALPGALGAELLLQDPNFPDPSLGVQGLCKAFELLLKKGFLAQFCESLRQQNVRYFPENEWLDEKHRLRRPQVLVGGRQKERLNLGDIAKALDSPRKEIPEFCASQKIDLPRLRKAIGMVKDYRNPATHDKSISYVEAMQIRERLLGVAWGDGGVFGALMRLR